MKNLILPAIEKEKEALNARLAAIMETIDQMGDSLTMDARMQLDIELGQVRDAIENECNPIAI